MFGFDRFKSPKFSRAMSYYQHRMLPRKQQPHEVALAVAIGVWIGVMPTIGVAILLTLPVCHFMKLPKIPAILGSMVANPLTQFTIFYPSGYFLGKVLLPPKTDFDFLKRFGELSWSNFGEIAMQFLGEAKDHFFAFLIGMVIVSTFWGVLFYFGTYSMMNRKLNKLNSQA
ncbi:DUF2062 domain-containing protein [bacterium]|nr:DUF2062 domain-containing protein [bacterium]